MKYIFITSLLLFKSFFIFGEVNLTKSIFSGYKDIKIHAKSAVLIDLDSGEVLFEKDPDASIPPASLTKLVTIFTSLKLAKEKNIPLSTKINIGPDAYYKNAPPHSSLMFLGENQTATLDELLLGLSVTSGNDSGIALAEALGGSVDSFVKRMNEEIDGLGLSKDIHFYDPHGYSEQNRITAKSFAKFCISYLKQFPFVIEKYHSIKTFSYPKSANMISGPARTMVQRNTNTLLKFEYVNGLKTGFINESGYNLALTAKKDNRSILAVILGVFPENGRSGPQLREDDGKILLNYAFENFTSIEKRIPQIDPIKIYMGQKDSLNDFQVDYGKISIPLEKSPKVLLDTRYVSEIKAPIYKGDLIGYTIYSVGDLDFYKVNLYAGEDVKVSPGIKGFLEGISINLAKLFGKKIYDRDEIKKLLEDSPKTLTLKS